MANSKQLEKERHEGRIRLAIQALDLRTVTSVRVAARTYNVRRTVLQTRYNGVVSRRDSEPNCKKLTRLEEEALVRYILNLDGRGFSPQLSEVGDMANKLLAARDGGTVGINWPSRLIDRTEELKMSFNRPRDHQRWLQECPEIVGAWFQLVANVKAKYGIQDADTYNFDETGFQMGIIGSSKVVTGSERREKPAAIQAGDREWVTVIQGIGALGYVLPPFTIYKGKNHLSNWYQETSIPGNWMFAVSDNGWTNNKLGLAWLKHFNRHTKERTVGSHRLLLIDGHESHQSQDFKDYCEEHKIITLCMPAHSSHILQPLDVGCFSPLKRKYKSNISALARIHIHHVDKMTFLPAFQDAFNACFTEKNVRSSFRGAGLVPFDPESVISTLNVQPRTPTPPPTNTITWQSKTPGNTLEFGLQSRLITTKLGSSPSSMKDGIDQLIKGAHQVVHQFELMHDRVATLEKALEEATKRKSRKRKRIQKGDEISFENALQLVPLEDGTVGDSTKKSRSKARADGAQPTQRRCGNCGETGHNARTCQIVEDSPTESSDSENGTLSESTVD